MAIVVEDGSVVTGANSYVTTEELRTYADERGIALTEDEEEQQVLLIKAMDRIEMFRDRFHGSTLRPGQRLAWPRWYGSNTGIPEELKRAQIVYAIAARNVDLIPGASTDTVFTKRKTVGPITMEYESVGRGTTYPAVPEADALIARLSGYAGGQLRVVRG